MAQSRIEGRRPMQHGAKSLSEFLEACRAFMRVRRLSLRTEDSYLFYIRRFIQFHNRKPEDMGEAEAFLSHMALQEHVAASTQNVAFAALVYLYREILNRELVGIWALRANRPRRVPDVLSKHEIHLLLAKLSEPHHLIASLLYGAGLRLCEGQRLRVQDVDFDGGLLLIRAGKGDKDRHAVLPQKLVRPLYDHLNEWKAKWQSLQAERPLPVSMPDALASKYPNAPFEWNWQCVFSSPNPSVDPLDNLEKRHHFLGDTFQCAVKRAAPKPASPNVFLPIRFATHLLEAGYNIRIAQDLLDHKDVRTTQIYLYTLNRPDLGVVSPLDV